MQRIKSKLAVGKVRLALTAVMLLVLMVVWGFLISGKLNVQEVVSSSMAPTLLIGDRVLVSEDHDRKIDVGDVVVVRSQDPDDPFPLIKRVAAMPGDFVVTLENQVFVNRKPTRDEAKRRLGKWPPQRSHMYTLAPDQYFVLGDNRGNSFDSVYFGPVTREDIIGHALVRYAPLDRFGKL